MGSCWSTNPPQEDDIESDLEKSKTSTTTRKTVEFGKEEVKLNELLGSLRTGLAFVPAEFSVLPGNINTTAQVKFTIGSSELQRRQEAKESIHTTEISGETEEQDATREGNQHIMDVEPFKLKVSLKGQGWTKGLVMGLHVQPIFGQFTKKTLQFHWRDDILEVVGCKKGELQAHSLPVSFEDEAEFCKCCLLLTYQSHQQSEQFDEDFRENNDINQKSEVATLTSCSYRVAVSNLDAISSDTKIPARLYHILYGSQAPVDIALTLWPKSCVTNTAITMKVKAGILFTELIYLVKEHLKINPKQTLKIYREGRSIHMSEVVSSECTHLDCFVVTRDTNNVLTGSYTSLDEASPHSMEENLVVSLVGERIQEVEADLEMPMKEFDALVREKFNLGKDSFLIILAEDDFAPQYTADDNWKCTYPFSITDNSFGAGLRRSFHRLSTWRQGAGERPHTNTPTTEATFAPLMAEVIKLLSSNERRFPQNTQKCGMSVQELYESMPMYQLSIEQCGIHPYAIIQVFEVTGPCIPITVRVQSDYSDKNLSNQLHTRLANIMDINPNWSINTLLQYIEAVISHSSLSRKRRLLLKDNSVGDENDNLSSLKLGVLLDNWKPLWWAEGRNRRQLTVKDLDPSEYLIVEKF